MEKMSQEKILKKLKKKKINENEIEYLIKNYFLNGYDLNELFKLLDNYDIYDKISEYANMIEKCYDICDIKKIDINNERVKSIIKRSLLISMSEPYISELSSFLKIYYYDSLRFVHLDTLVKMYLEDKNNELFAFILDRISHIDVTNALEAFSRLRVHISDKQKYDILDEILNHMVYNDLMLVKNNLLPEEFEYIRLKSLTNANRYGKLINQFIYDDLLTDEKRKNHIDEIVKLGYTESIYMLLVNCNLTHDETVKLQKALESAKDEYYFYYLLRTNIKLLLNVFGSYLAIKAFVESNGMFSNEEEIENVLDTISIEVNNEVKSFNSEINAPVYKVRPNRLKKRKIPNA